MNSTTTYRPGRLTLLVALLGLPGVLSLLPALPAALAALPPGGPSPAVMMLLTVIQSMVMITIAAAIGAWLSPKVGFKAPGLTGEGFMATIRKHAPVALGAGILVGIVTVALEAAVFRPYLPQNLYMLSVEPRWLDLVPAFLYGGIFEEILMRWGLLTLIVWVLYRLRGGKGEVHPAFVWAGILGAALLFALGHLPAVKMAVGDVTTPIIIRTVVQNGLPGILFGWIYTRRGLESAMLAHMGAHIGMFIMRLLFA